MTNLPRSSIPLSSRYRRAEQRVREGFRETPQRFRPLAWRLAREPGDWDRIWSLYSWVLRSMASEFRGNPSRPQHLTALVERARVLVDERFVAEDMAALEAEVRALAPRRYRRRNIHSRSQIGTDRVLLVLRTMLPTLDSIGRGTGWLHDGAVAWAIELTLAYFVADYDYDHFVFMGPQVADRFLVVALWCQGHMPGDGLDSLRARRL